MPQELWHLYGTVRKYFIAISVELPKNNQYLNLDLDEKILHQVVLLDFGYLLGKPEIEEKWQCLRDLDWNPTRILCGQR